jgi:hypothetical protein
MPRIPFLATFADVCCIWSWISQVVALVVNNLNPARVYPTFWI